LPSELGGYASVPTDFFWFDNASPSDGIREDFNEAIASALEAALLDDIFEFFGTPMRNVPKAFAPASTDSWP